MAATTLASPTAFSPQAPVTRYWAAFPFSMRFMGIWAKSAEAPPWRKRISCDAGTARSSRRSERASSWTASYSLPRWLCSMTDMPLPARSSSSSRARSSAGRGSAAGPALKFILRAMVCLRATVRGAGRLASLARGARRRHARGGAALAKLGDGLAGLGGEASRLVVGDDLEPGLLGLLRVLLVVGVDDAGVEEALHVRGGHLVRLEEVGERLVVLAELPVHHALVGEDVGVLRVEGQRVRVGVDGGLELAAVEVVVAEGDPGLDVLRVLGHELLGDGDALLDSLGGARHPALGQGRGRHRAGGQPARGRQGGDASRRGCDGCGRHGLVLLASGDGEGGDDGDERAIQGGSPERAPGAGPRDSRRSLACRRRDSRAHGDEGNPRGAAPRWPAGRVEWPLLATPRLILVDGRPRTAALAALSGAVESR